MLSATQAVVNEQRSDTPQGGVAIIANQLGLVGRMLGALRDELQVSDRLPDNYVVNAYVASAAAGLQSVGDAVASFCQHHAPDDTIDGRVHFSTYEFKMTAFEFVRPIKKKIDALRHGNQNFNQLANYLKHEHPFLGLVTQHEFLHDVYDDTNRTGVLRGMLIPAYKLMTEILHRIAQQFAMAMTFPGV